MAIQRRLKAEPAPVTAWKERQAKNFNADPKLVAFFEQLDTVVQRNLDRMYHEAPELWARLQECSWDRKAAGIIMWLSSEDPIKLDPVEPKAAIVKPKPTLKLRKPK